MQSYVPKSLNFDQCIQLRQLLKISARFSSSISDQKKPYVQGQLVNKERQYFYFIDHQGMLFLDDARMKNFTSCFKEKKFLKFFLKRVKLNSKDNRGEWPYVSPCGDEMNYIRCDDLPIVYQAIVYDGGVPYLSWGDELGLLKFPLDVSGIAMCPLSGRVYHPAPLRQGSIGLMKSKLAIELSNNFVFEENAALPSAIIWKNQHFPLHNKILSILEDRPSLGRYSEVTE